MNDIRINQDFKIELYKGDFEVTSDEMQRASLIIASAKGDWRQSPLVGANIKGAILAPINEVLKRSILIQLQADGLQPKKLQFVDDKLEVKL